MTVAKDTSPSGVASYFPILHWLPRYQREWLGVDVMAGLSVWALLVPSALAYSSVAGVPTIGVVVRACVPPRWASAGNVLVGSGMVCPLLMWCDVRTIRQREGRSRPAAELRSDDC